jgi:hypothetical protein
MYQEQRLSNQGKRMRLRNSKESLSLYSSQNLNNLDEIHKDK